MKSLVFTNRNARFNLELEKIGVIMRMIIILLAILLLITACENKTIVKKIVVEQNITPENVTEAIPVNITNETVVEVKDMEVFIPRTNNLTIYYLNIKGNSVLVQYKDKSVLIDSGFEADSEKILKRIRDLGIEKLDYVFATNRQPKNIGGIPYIILRTEPSNVVENGVPPSLNNSVVIKNLIKIKSDIDFNLDNVLIKTIVVYDDGDGFSVNLDDNSLVTKIHYGNSRFLFMSDCGFDCEERLKDEDLTVDVLKISNSCEATSLAFLQKVNPQVAIVAADASFCPNIKDRFKFLNIPLYITGEKGNIFVSTDGLSYMVGWKMGG